MLKPEWCAMSYNVEQSLRASHQIGWVKGDGEKAVLEESQISEHCGLGGGVRRVQGQGPVSPDEDFGPDRESTHLGRPIRKIRFFCIKKKTSHS